MKIVIAGGSGQVGTVLARHFHEKGDNVIVLSRSLVRAPWHTEQWDGQTVGSWLAALDGSDVLINLAGRSVNCRYNEQNREAILVSRVQSTEILHQALRKLVRRPPVWLTASTATIYSHRYDAPNDDQTGVIGGTDTNAPATWRFSTDVAFGLSRQEFCE